AYLLEGIKEIGNISPFRAKAVFNDKEIEDEFLFLSVSNSTSIAGLFKLNQLDVRLDDGEFEVMLIRNPKNAVELMRVLSGLTSGKYDPRYIIFDHARTVSIQTEAPLAWTLDGEAGGSHTAVNIGVLDDAIRIFY
ncbi:MAG: diacylglycerol kinase family lipid kinase, partial [Clostridia bacterium]|nr:diacylglycerol kinase family lipid kinase [Clostridia bacterium]